jgi:hypothetical protein
VSRSKRETGNIIIAIRARDTPTGDKNVCKNLTSPKTAI